MYSARTGRLKSWSGTSAGARVVASRVIHVGTDSCHRLPVLESAGYQVDTCISALELQNALTAAQELDAVLISEGAGGPHPDVVLLARSRSSAPIVLFRETQLTLSESSFDLVVPVLDPPQTWLADIAALIARCQSLRFQSQALCNESVELRRESQLARTKSSRERQRSQREYGKKMVPPDGLISGPDGEK
jgi:hypothetical protein